MISPVKRFTLVCVFCSTFCPALSWADEPHAEPAWPYRRLTRPDVPQVANDDWPHNPIDCFVLDELEKRGLAPSAPADRETILSRVVYDLTGLAPGAAERESFLSDPSPQAYEHLVDRLLASPHYGERWAQHWLDLVRYSESDGFKLDSYRPNAWRYRDYVIRAFNTDLPYDRFLQQQLAGDELEPENPDAIVATGFLRLHPEEILGANYREIRQDILDDVTEVTGLAFLGLTVGCAKCHDHKFDPISQEDYFRTQAFFAGLLPCDDASLVRGDQAQEVRKELDAWEKNTTSIRSDMESLLAPVGKQVFAESVVALDGETQAALKAPPKERTPLQMQLAAYGGKQISLKYKKMHRRLQGDDKARYDELKKRLDSFSSTKPFVPTAMAVKEVGAAAPPTHRLIGGDYRRPRREMQPGFLECLDHKTPVITPSADSSGRRAAFARWLSEPDHPLTSRVIVNRLWQRHFGKGIVGTPSDFGVKGERPTHPDLLDWLAAELVAKGWSLKSIQRLMVTSATYRQSSAPESNLSANRAGKADPSNAYLWHQRVRRRDAESIRDAALQASGRLNPRMFGESACPELPPSIRTNSRAWDPDAKIEDRDRRSVYVFNRRNLEYPLFAAFDSPNRVLSCAARNCTTSAPQALLMLNGEFAVQQAQALAGRLLAEPDGQRNFVKHAYLAMLKREATAHEVSFAELFLEQQEQRIARAGTAPQVLPEPKPDGVSAAAGAAFVDLCHALLNSAEFLYVE